MKPLRLADDEVMLPVAVKLADYVHQLLIDGATGEKEKQMRIEVLGMLTVMERNLACLVPLRVNQGRVVWKVCYPKGSLFLNGPEYHGAWGAIARNYTHNGKFKRILGIEGGRGDLVLDINKITRASVDVQRKATDTAKAEGGLDLADFKTMKEQV